MQASPHQARSTIHDILTFWFEDPTGITAKRQKVWFIKTPEFDQTIRDRFSLIHQQASRGEFDDWMTTAPGCLALILVLDQFSRHLFRQHPQAFATDAKALAVAQHAIAQNFDQTLPKIQRWFLYMPFMHSEDLEIQRQSVELFCLLADDPDASSAYPYAIKHHDVIQRFGRFPHRNAILGRINTPEETEFLQQPGSSF